MRVSGMRLKRGSWGEKMAEPRCSLERVRRKMEAQHVLWQEFGTILHDGWAVCACPYARLLQGLVRLLGMRER